MLKTTMVLSTGVPSIQFLQTATHVANPTYDPAQPVGEANPQTIHPAELGLYMIQQNVPNSAPDLKEAWVYGLEQRTLYDGAGNPVQAYIEVDGPTDFWATADYTKLPDSLIEGSGLSPALATQIKQAKALAKLSPEDRALLGL